MLFGLLASTPAEADAQSSLDLRWEAPPGCPQEDAVRERVRALAPDAARKGEGLRAEGKIVRSDGRFRLTLLVNDGKVSGERRIDSDSCADLAGAAAVALALVLRGEEAEIEGSDPGAASSPGPSDTRGPDASARQDGETAAPRTPPSRPSAPARAKRPPASAPDDRAEADEPEPREPSADEEDARGWRVVLGAPLIGVSIGALPEPSLAAGAALGLRDHAWRFMLAASLSPSQSVRAPDSPDHGADIGRAAAALFACRRVRGRRLELGPCVSLSVDRATAEGFGDDVTPRQRHPVWLGAGVGAFGYWHALDGAALFVHAGALVHATRPRISIDGLGEVYRIAPAEATLALGAEWAIF